MSSGNQEGIVLNSDKSVEAQLQHAKDERQKKQKKQKRRKIIFIVVIAVLVLGIIIISAVVSTMAKHMPLTVFTITPERGDLESVIYASGLTESEKVVHYYAPAGILVDESVRTGDKVAKGDVMITFDEDDYAFVLKEAELENKITNNSYQSSVTNHNEIKQNLATARADVKKYQELVNAQQAVVDELVRTITDANAIKVANLQNQAYEAQKAISEFNYNIVNAEELGISPEGVKTYTAYIQEKEELIQAINHEINLTSSSATAYDQQKRLTAAQNLLSDHMAELERAKAEVETYEGALGNQYDAENIVLNGQLSTMRTEQAYQELLAYQEGVKADFHGVISMSSVEPGVKTVAGTEMLTLASLEDVKVSFSVTKSGLEEVKLGQKAVVEILGKEYEGTVSRINNIATSTTNGGTSVIVEVRIDKPDENIYLGVDAKIELCTNAKTDVVMLPVEAVSADKEGEFVYLVVNGIVEKRYVTLGISSDEYVEIADGLTETDEVISMVSSEIEEGIPVMAMPEISDEEMEMMMEEMY